MFIICARILITICFSGNRSLPGNTEYQKIQRSVNAVLSVLNLSEISFYNEVKIKVKIFVILNYPFLSCWPSWHRYPLHPKKV